MCYWNFSKVAKLIKFLKKVELFEVSKQINLLKEKYCSKWQTYKISQGSRVVLSGQINETPQGGKIF